MGEQVNSCGDDRTVNNTLRQKYRVLSEEEKMLCDLIRASGDVLLGAIEAAPQGREASLARTKVEEAVMWAIKGVTK